MATEIFEKFNEFAKFIKLTFQASVLRLSTKIQNVGSNIVVKIFEKIIDPGNGHGSDFSGRWIQFKI